MLVFPETAEDMAAAFNSGLAMGEFDDNVASPSFWGFYELLGSVVEDDGSIVDVFRQLFTLEFKRIERSKERNEQ